MKLTLFFTEGVSLQTWNSIGSLERELALYTELIKRGHEVELMTYGGTFDSHLAARFGMRPRTNSLGLPANLYKRSVLAWPPRGNVFKSNQVRGAELGLQAARRAKVKFVARGGYLPSLNEERRAGRNSSEAIAARELERRVFTAADAVIVTTESMKQTVANEYQVPSRRVNVVPNYVETETFRPQPKAHTGFSVVYVGRLAPEKNLSALVDACSGAVNQLQLIGSGPETDALKLRAEKQKTNVKFLGNIGNHALPAILNAADVFVLPSLYEGHPKSLLEAMACGLAVIGTRVPGIQELIRDGETGLLCEPDATSIKSAIQRLSSDANLRAQLGQSARQFVLDNFSLPHVVDLEMAVYEKLGVV
jgi:glycosyltransferase involved in cell wall biosynthesis